MLQDDIEDDHPKSGSEVGKGKTWTLPWLVCVSAFSWCPCSMWHSLSGTTLCYSTQIQALHPAKKVKPTKVNIIVKDGIIDTDGLLGPAIKRPTWLTAVPYVAMLEDAGQIQKPAATLRRADVVLSLVSVLSPSPIPW